MQEFNLNFNSPSHETSFKLTCYFLRILKKLANANSDCYKL